MTPNIMPPRIAPVSGNVSVEQIATDLSMQYNPLTQAALVVLNFRGVLLVDGAATDLSGDKRTQVVITTDQHGATKYADGIIDPVSGVDLSNVTAAGIMVYLKALAAKAYDAQFDAEENAPRAEDETDGKLPQPLE